jgi:predicted ABC-type ATPase
MTRTCWIIAGPNGAGKTTFAQEYLPTVVGCSHFINVDLIAAGLAPLAPERELLAASRIFLREIEVRAGKCEDFAFETTLAGSHLSAPGRPLAPLRLARGT